VTRRDTSNRRVSNESDLIDTLEKYGFEIFAPSEHDFAAQVQEFASADIVCGPLGSALTNLIFSDETTKIIALIPAEWEDRFFIDLAFMRGQRWYELRGPVTNQISSLYHRNDFKIDPSQFERLLMQVCN